MIHILFVPGMFGSMLEWGIRSYSSYYKTPPLEVNDDGSMHSHYKMSHPRVYDELMQISNINDPSCITTSIHPMIDYDSIDVINFLNKFEDDKHIFINVSDINSAEIIILMQYYKIFKGLNLTLESIINNDKSSKNFYNWNPSYTHWSELNQWELREWFSIYYPDWVSEWIDASKHVDDNWLIIDPQDLVYNYNTVIEMVIDFCGLEYVANESADNVVASWVQKQLLIISEHRLIDEIIEKTLSKNFFSWDELTFLHEAMIQKKLRDRGYEIKCYNLNKFPTNSIELYNLLDI